MKCAFTIENVEQMTRCLNEMMPVKTLKIYFIGRILLLLIVNRDDTL